MRTTLLNLEESRIREVANVGMGRDHSLFALVDGQVSFAVKGPRNRQTVAVTPV